MKSYSSMAQLRWHGIDVGALGKSVGFRQGPMTISSLGGIGADDRAPAA